MTKDKIFHCGYVAIVGFPNVGKSTLLNRLLGQKLSIVNSKPQTTRKNIVGILTEKKFQIIFLDTPGFLHPNYLLQEKMMQNFNNAVNDADIIVLMLDAVDDPTGEKMFHHDILKQIQKNKTSKKIFVLNKIDIAKESDYTSIMNRFTETNIFHKQHAISAAKRENVNILLQTIVSLLPEHPAYYPDEIVSSEQERFFVSEIIREKILELYREEIPYSCEVVIENFTEKEGRKDYIKAVIYVEKDSQKGILIGKQGEAMKKLGAATRVDVENFLGREVFLELFVKIKKNWRGDEDALKFFGYIN